MRRGQNLAVFIFLLLWGALFSSITNPLFARQLGQNPEDSSFPNLIENGDFEVYSPLAKQASWRLAPEACFEWGFFSHSGERALTINASQLPQSSKGTASAAVTYRLRNIKPNTTYLFEAYFYRDKNIVGVYPSVSVFGRQRRLDDFWREDGWQKISLFFKSPPQIRPGVRPPLEIRIPKDGFRLWIDDLSLREFGIRLLSPRNNEQVGGSLIRFAWESPGTDRLLTQKITLSKSRVFEPARSFEFFGDNVFNLRASWTLDSGTWYWRVSTYQYNQLIALSPPEAFVFKGRLSRHQADKMPDGIMFGLGVDRPANINFFPIGIYSADSADFAELKEIGFNAIHVSSTDLPEISSALIKAQKNGLRVLIPYLPTHSQLHEPELLPDTHTSHLTLYTGKGTVLFSEKKNRPLFVWLLDWLAEKLGAWETILGFYLADEPEGRGISPKTTASNQADLTRFGFSQPGVIAMNRSWRAQDYAQSSDIIMAAAYPVPFMPLSWLSDCLDEIQGCLAGDRAKRVWAVIQAFGWNEVTQEIEQSGLGREPRPDEIRALAYLAVAHRAGGLFFFTYGGGDYSIKNKKDLWAGVKKTVGELREMFPLLEAKEVKKAGAVSMECAVRDASGLPAVHYILKEVPTSEGNIENGIYLIAVNSTAKETSTKFVFKGPLLAKLNRSPEATDFFSAEKYPLIERSLRISFLPYARVVAKLD